MFENYSGRLVAVVLSIIEIVRKGRSLVWMFERLAVEVQDYAHEFASERTEELHSRIHERYTEGFNLGNIRGYESGKRDSENALAGERKAMAAIGSLPLHSINTEAMREAMRSGNYKEASGLLAYAADVALDVADDEIRRRSKHLQAWGYAAELATYNSDKIRDAVLRGNKIEAIKYLREATLAGLKESKDEIERRMNDEPEKWGYKRPDTGFGAPQD